jgi:hypothetical protein
VDLPVPRLANDVDVEEAIFILNAEQPISTAMIGAGEVSHVTGAHTARPLWVR